ncbi:hypothetical protein JM84_2690 [Dokdonia sp. Hel_I_63]|uniref:hypothetical protein n=1 Tax=unclassified Dokdonia TaxID=2615033 RepID=UPI00020A62D8|nr:MULTISPECIES: hypothetical protein [unclassified Dokdonia]AEE20009.1 hypothetical protein Krodi_2026 [Dokdonia sp. 4H-3-7-5]TVZ23737.1 hypothetical protein JM84_2690 [Dokdonia sp. Hel_I_63]
MITNPIEIDLALRAIIKRHEHHLQVRKDDSAGLEVAGTIPTMQGKQKVDGFYFASVIPKPKDCRLYFFPIYTDVAAFTDIDPALRKCLKGKSCFHIKKMDASLEASISDMIDKGIAIYQEKGLLTST